MNKCITFIDIDETLFKTKALIRVVKDGIIVDRIDNNEMKNYELGYREEFDFVEFDDAELFVETSEPIETVISEVREMFDTLADKGSKFYILTARRDLDKPKKLIDFMNSHGLPVGHEDEGKIHILRAGNIPGYNNGLKKKNIVREFLKNGKFTTARLYDDDERNLIAFKELQTECANVEFLAYHVNGGEISKF